jgi:glycosyltransferase involved in cell wall biosynthesis
MNILFVLYGDFSSNSVHPLALYARELHKCGHNCAVVVPNNLETIQQCPNVFFRPLLYDDALHDPESIFPDGRPADVIHAWTPREVVRRFVTSYMAKRPTPLIVYLEDHESWIACRALGLEEAVLVQQTDQSISERIRDGLSHPFRYDSFIGLADAAAVIQDKLEVDVPPWVHCETVMPGVDLEFFSPRMADPLLRKQYGIAENERVIVYPGGLNEFTRSSIETLCRAVCLINKQGYPCRLLRTGPFALDFIDQLPSEAAALISDLGVLPRSELPDLLALADVFVQPGKIDPFEDLRLPGKLPEFLAMGRPVVMPDVNIAHLFEDGVNAVLTRTGSAEEIAAKCIELFSDPQKAERIGQGGRKFAEKYFDLQKQATRLENVYKIACDNFYPDIAKDLWLNADKNSSVTLLLARKLNLLADSQATKFSQEVGEILKEHARYIGVMQRRVGGLEVEMAERDGQIVNLNQAVVDRDGQIVNLNQAVVDRDGQIVNLNRVVDDRDGQIAHLSQAVAELNVLVAALHNSTSWKITSPLRVVYLQAKRIKRVTGLAGLAVSRGGGVRNTVLKAFQLYRREGFTGIKRGFRVVAMSNEIPLASGPGECGRYDYVEWVRRYDTLTDETRFIARAQIERFFNKPLISVVMPTYNAKPEWLIEAIESVRNQIYPHWELCIADDASTDKAIRPILEHYTKNDSRIKVVFHEKNGHISMASNSALELVSGEWVALLDHDDLISEHALFWVAQTINQYADARLIYSDEDKIDEIGKRSDPYFKCDWNEDLFYSHNMFSHLGVYNASLLREIGGFRLGLEGSQDYDLALRCIERIKPDQIRHIPHVLYHWRVHAESTAQSSDAKPYAMLAGERALNEHFQRLNVDAKAELIGFGYRVRYGLPRSLPLVSVIIPTRNGLQLIKQCVQSIFEKTTYSNYELLIVDNGSDDPNTLEYFDSLKTESRVRVLRDDRPFNYSALNNAAVRFAKGELIALLNNDIEVISPEWLSEMVSHAVRPGIGAVGARLWYPDNTLQHAGVILGLGAANVAGHPHCRMPRGHHGYFGRASLCQSFSAVTAACLVIRREIYEKVEGLNEVDLQVTFNDVDFCLRVREAGFRNVWTPYAELYHHESASRGSDDVPEKRARFDKEVQYMKRRWGKLLPYDPAYNPNLTLDYSDFSLSYPPRIDAFMVDSIFNEDEYLAANPEVAVAVKSGQLRRFH